MARSFDRGRTWSTDLLFDRTPDGERFDNYYNAMNGTFVSLGHAEAMYVFGHFRPGPSTCAQTIALDGVRTKQHYPERLRRIRYKDPQSDKTLVFLTNRTGLDALTVYALYQSRWQVELFFKWVKQHLRVKRFLAVSENAVKTQLWVAVSVYVLVAIIRKRLEIDTPLYTMLQILSVMPFAQVSIQESVTMK